ncbi:major facilitator superfamily protein [Hyphomicrobium denitrificans 1NES1]|uniref:Major facilitator superfamily protein n=1 Tax=Hyphomicrobium denitrificans 1NES1 TaxID=670307 RepID=N0B9N1_9HYPH|nr:nitrate/nitrite transporter [Hyphomicrobium denitrificans]AGK56805.1 major facilitator superfamily protein [Hyphomicrobium denitrificans 1NES1]
MTGDDHADLGLASAESRALWASTLAFTVCFAVWTIFSIVGVRIKQELALSETEFGLLVGTPILTGSLSRIFLGIWTDRFGGRLVFTIMMLATSLATILLAFAHTYPQILLAALGVGLAGGSFAVGVAYVSRFFPQGRQGTALGIFGVGNVGAAVTKFAAPFVLLAWGWQAVALVWAAALILMATIFYISTVDDPVIIERRRTGIAAKSFMLELSPLRDARVWRFASYYFFVFGAFVALALWLPRYLIGVYGFNIETAGLVGALYSIPASIFRAYGGMLSDRIGARTVMYWSLGVSAVATLILSLPPTSYVMRGINGDISSHFEIGIGTFVVAAFVLGFFMSLGKAAVFKHIASYYPGSVGAVGGVVGMIGGLGGFALPIAFGALNDLTGLWSSCFMLLFAISVGLLFWMDVAVRRMRGAPASVSKDRANTSVIAAE